MKISPLTLVLISLLYNSAYSFVAPSSRLSVSATHLPRSFSVLATVEDEDVDISYPGYDEPVVELSDTEIELIARNLKETIDFPFLPNALEKQIVKAALTSFCKAAPIALPKGLFEELVSGNQDWDNVKEIVINDLNDAICIPIVSREVQDKIVDSVCTVMFTSKSQKAATRQMIGRVLQTSLNQDSEEEFATMLNGMVDIPFMSEEQEQILMRKLVRRINKAFETMVPEEMREMLTQSSPEELQEARNNLIDRLNDKIDIPFKSYDEERVYFAAIVDFLLKRYGLEKGTKMPHEELDDCLKELEMIEVELEVQESIYEKRIEELTGRKNSFLARKKELEKLM